MNRVKQIVAALFMASVLMSGSVSCTSSDERAEQEAAAQEAAQMEGRLPDPTEAGRMAARKFLTRSWKDSLQLHSQLLEVRAMQSRYELEGSKQDAAVFDSVFISTLETVNPAVCAEIKREL